MERVNQAQPKKWAGPSMAPSENFKYQRTTLPPHLLIIKNSEHAIFQLAHLKNLWPLFGPSNNDFLVTLLSHRLHDIIENIEILVAL